MQTTDNPDAVGSGLRPKRRSRQQTTERKFSNGRICSLFTVYCSLRKGFTLIEVLVSLAVFTILMVSSLGIYTYTVKAQRRTIELNRIQREAQFILEAFAKRVRSSVVDYGYYEGSGPVKDPVPVFTYDLALRDKDRIQTIFRVQDGMVAVKEADGEFEVMTAQSVVLRDLKFFISPEYDPFTLSNVPETQPKVIIVMQIASSKPDSPVLTVQQSVPQRSGGF